MTLRAKLLAVLLGQALLAASATGADDKTKFTAGPASSYPNRQTNDHVTVAADVFETADKAKPAFGKVNPAQYGALPILVVIHNKSAKSLDLSGIRVEYITPDRDRIEYTPADEVPYVYGNRGRKVSQNPIPTGAPRIRGKNPLSAVEIQNRAFAARMLPPGDQASGFFYFQANHRGGSKLYVTGLREAGSGKELFYFELPLPDIAR